VSVSDTAPKLLK